MADPGIRVFEVELLVEGGVATLAHVRTQARANAAAILAGLPTTGANVFDSRPEGRDWNSGDLPGLNVLTPTDALDLELSKTEGKEAHELRLVVESRAKGEGSAAVADQGAAEAQAAIFSEPTLGGVAKRILLLESKTSISGEIETPTAIVRMEFAVLYRILSTDPETSIP